MSGKEASLQGAIAVVGMACRVPGARDYRQYWENLRNGVSSITEIPDSRWSQAATFSTDINEPGKSTSKWGGLVDEVTVFDHVFFGLSPREAKSLDPQQRLLMQEAWRCIEDSGIPLARLQSGRTNVTIGVMALDYYRETGKDDRLVDAYACLGNYECILANRLSHVLDLRGESKAIDTACSSSLVAVHDARRALLLGECDYALAGGVSLILNPFRYIAFSKSRMLSTDGRCKTFDAAADGYVPGEGVGLVLLQRLDDALRAGHVIHGVIVGSNVNHNGNNLDITAPSVEAQIDVIRRAHAAASLDTRSVGYIEAHGTGTSLGDPIEVEALSRWRRAECGDSTAELCQLGSVKTNIGHLEAAAGIAGLIKVILMMKHRTLAPTLNLKTENPLIDFERTPFRPVLQAESWLPAPGFDWLAAGVSSFGFGGTNAHVVVHDHRAEFPAHPPLAQRPVHYLALSAKSTDRLRAMLGQWQQFGRTPDGQGMYLPDVEATLLTGRAHFAERILIPVPAGANLVDQINAALARLDRECWNSPANRIDMRIKIGDDLRPLQSLYDELHSRHPQMADDVAAVEAFVEYHPERAESVRAFARAFACAAHIARLVRVDGWEGKGQSWWVVLAVSGWLSLEDALSGFLQPLGDSLTLAQRGNAYLFDSASGLKISPSELDREVLGRLIAQLRFSVDEIQSLWQKASRLIGHQYTFRHYLKEWPVKVPDMAQDALTVLERYPHFEAFAENCTDVNVLTRVCASIVSSLRRLNKKWNLSGLGTIADPASDLLIELIAEGVLSPRHYLDVAEGGTAPLPELELHQRTKLDRVLSGPHGHLLPMTPLSLRIADGKLDLGRTAAVTDEKSPPTAVLDLALAEAPDGRHSSERLFVDLLHLWERGANVHWPAWYSDAPIRRVALPGYCFGGKEHGLSLGAPAPVREKPAHVGATKPVESVPAGLSQSRSLAFRFDPQAHQVLRDHIITGSSILPAAAMVALGVAAAMDKGQFSPIRIDGTLFMRPGRPQPCLSLTAEFERDTGRYRVADEQGTLCQGRLSLRPETNVACQAQEEAGTAFPDWYRVLADAGYHYGPSFQTVLAAWPTSTSMRAQLRRVDDPDWTSAVISPGLLDGVFQVVLIAVRTQLPSLNLSGRILVPAALERFELHDLLTQDCSVEVGLSELRQRGSSVFANARVFGLDGRLLADLEGLVLQAVPIDFLAVDQLQAVPERAAMTKDDPAALYKALWVPAPLDTSAVPSVRPLAKEAVVLCPRLDSKAFPLEDLSRVHALVRVLEKNHRQVRMVRFDVEEAAVSECVSALVRSGAAAASIWFLAPELEHEDNSVVEALALNLRLGMDALFLCIRSLLQERQTTFGGEGLTLTAVSCSAWRVLEDDIADGFAMAGYAGLAKVLNLESRALRLRVIDVDDATLVSSQCPDLLARESSCDEPSEPVAYRRGRRYRQATMRLPISGEQAGIRSGGVYLITGGLGGIGRQLALTLLRHTACTVVLTGRTLPSSTELDALASACPAGSTLDMLPCDLGDERAVDLLVAEIECRHGPLTGIFHAAGVLRDGFLAGKSLQSFHDVMRAKTLGTWNLYQRTRHHPLAFFVAFSSVVGWVGNVGQSDYAAANAILDSLMSHCAARSGAGGGSTRFISVAWTLWSNGGMGRDERIEAHFSRMGFPAISTEKAIDALLRSLGGRDVNISICARPAPPLDALLIALKEAVFSNRTAGSGLPPATLPSQSPIMKNAHTSTKTVDHWMADLVGIIGEVLAVDPCDIEPQVLLRDYGIDSVTISLIAERISLLRGETILPSLLAEHPTVGALAQALASMHTAGSAPKRSEPDAMAPSAAASIRPSAVQTPASGPSGVLLERLGQLNRFSTLFGKTATASVQSHLQAQEPVQHQSPQAQSHPQSQLRPGVSETLARATQIVAEVLCIEAGDLDPDTALREYGIDSVTMSLVAERVGLAVGLPLHPGVLLEHPTLRSLALHLDGQIGGRGEPTPMAASSAAKAAGGSPARKVHATANANRAQAGASADWIAIIGCAGRLPQSDDIDMFWRHLIEGRDLVTEVPAQRWPVSGLFSPTKGLAGHTYSKWAGLIDHVYGFDACYFGMDDATALEIDPQQRVFLELVQHLWDHAGYTREEIKGTATGVFVGANESNYARKLEGRGKFNGKAGVVNVIANMIPGRVSDYYDLRGPSLSTYTACSSSLVALYQAVLALQRGDCDMAVAGGIELLLDEEWFVGFSSSQALSVDGRCKVFDESANGFVLGEGAGAVLLKPYEQAVRDGDRVLAVIEAIGINNDGSTMGLTTPNMNAQQTLIERVLERSGIDPATISYYEAHGTGTALGDPIEIRSATRAYRRFTETSGYCALGSVKSNIGHLLSAAGIASLLKIVLSLEHGRLPPTLHCRRPHPKFEFASTPFHPLQQAQAWHPIQGLRRAAASSFGFGGTNVHLIVREPEPTVLARRQRLPLTPFHRKTYRLGEQTMDEVSGLLDRLFDKQGIKRGRPFEHALDPSADRGQRRESRG